jgi:hypothetical protein
VSFKLPGKCCKGIQNIEEAGRRTRKLTEPQGKIWDTSHLRSTVHETWDDLRTGSRAG